MHDKLRRPRSRGVSVRSGQVEFVKVGADNWKWRDIYRWLLGLRWPQFAAFVAAVYAGLNLFFAFFYSLQQGSIAGTTTSAWFLDCFFFSVQTLATVGYGHMYPQTVYGHIVSTVEIMTGVFFDCGNDWLDFRPFLSTDRARCLQQINGDWAVEWKTHFDGAHRQ